DGSVPAVHNSESAGESAPSAASPSPSGTRAGSDENHRTSTAPPQQNHPSILRVDHKAVKGCRVI
ncbi:hypothetical protein HMPREF9374_0623, partial [Desmospora sp. 8437]